VGDLFLDNREIKLEVINLLKTLPVYFTNSAGIQHTIRCPYCGDSKNQSHGHFSIKIDIDNDNEPMLFRCFKCDVSGILTNDVLEEIGIDVSNDMANTIGKFNKSTTKSQPGIITKPLDYNVPIYSDTYINRRKLIYLNDRLGLNLTYGDCNRIKCILNFYDFIKLNNIEYLPDIKSTKIDLLNNNYIGFLSCNNNMIVFRNIYNDKYRRYEKVKLNNRVINPNSFYIIPNTFNMLYTDDMHIHIAEGIMDILSIYYNLKDKDDYNNFYFASCGFGSNVIIKYALSIGLNTNLIVHLYSDNDKTNADHLKYLNKIRNSGLVWIKKLIVHRNIYNGEKDYGVPKSNIDDSIFTLKLDI